MEVEGEVEASIPEIFVHGVDRLNRLFFDRYNGIVRLKIDAVHLLFLIVEVNLIARFLFLIKSCVSLVLFVDFFEWNSFRRSHFFDYSEVTLSVFICMNR